MINTNIEPSCPFCKSIVRMWHVTDTHNYFGFDCVICKQYFISGLLLTKASALPLGNDLLNCISENIKSNSSGGAVITSWHLESEITLPRMADDITVKRFESIASLPIIHSEKPEAILKKIASKLFNKSPIDSATITKSDLYELKIINTEEAIYWLKTCKNSGWITSVRLKSIESTMGWDLASIQIDSFDLSITPTGWQLIFQNRQVANSRKVFIAMQFNWGDELKELKAKYLEAVKRGCAECGYEADTVSQNHSDQITDRIIAEIKSSRFVIADFTFNNQGAYYEAGLARGLGLKVIHTIMKGHTEDPHDPQKRLHFDIRQINYLQWDKADELAEQIKNRIKAVIES